MEDEVLIPVVSRNLFRQSSIETPLSPSIPSDSESEDEDNRPQSKNAKGTASPKDDKSTTRASSMNKLRDRFENVGMIKVMPNSNMPAAAVPEDKISGSDNSDNKKPSSESKSDKQKEKPVVKPKTLRKKSFPPVPGRSDSLQQKISASNAMIVGELQSRNNEKADPIVGASESMHENTGGSSKDPASKEKKETELKPKITSGTASSKKSGPPPVHARSDSLQKQLSNELRNKCEKSGQSKVSVERGPQTIHENEAEDYDESNSAGNNTETTNAVSTIKAMPVMASPRPKSPRPVPVSAKKDEKEESFWEKIGTLGRKKRIKEVQEVQEEGKYAIDSPGLAANPDMPPEEYTLDENEERSMTDPRSLEDPKLQELIYVLIEWINDELADQRIIVKDIAEDLYDGQVLQKLLERLTGDKLDVPEVTQSEEGQKQKLAVVLSAANRVLDRYPPYKWSVDSVHSKNIVSILHLLVGLARQFRAPVRLPERVAMQVVVVRKKDGQLVHRTVREEITSTYEDLGMRCERDAFDTLFDHAPEKLAVVKKSLVSFVNKHLSKVHLEVTELETQFHDGVFLTLLLGLLEGFFVPLGSFHLTPKTHDQKVHNVSFAFDLMQEIGLVKPKARPEDIVNLDLKSTLRVLYNLFTKYKGIN